MRLNLKNLAKIEKQCRINDNHVSLNTIQQMLDVVLAEHKSDTGYELALNTLVDLGVIEDVEIKKEVKQLNS